MTARVLPVIAGLFLASGLFRLGDGMALALTEGVRDMTAPASEAPALMQADCPEPPDIAKVLAALREREAGLDAKQAALERRAATLAIAQEEVERQMATLTEAEQSLRSTLTLADEAAESDIARLTAVYENMKPEQASALFAQMAPDFAAGFLGRMRPEAAAGIMTGLDPATAYSISAVLAGRNARAPKE